MVLLATFQVNLFRFFYLPNVQKNCCAGPRRVKVRHSQFQVTTWVSRREGHFLAKVMAELRLRVAGRPSSSFLKLDCCAERIHRAALRILDIILSAILHIDIVCSFSAINSEYLNEPPCICTEERRDGSSPPPRHKRIGSTVRFVGHQHQVRQSRPQLISRV